MSDRDGWHILVEIDLDGEKLRLCDIDGGVDVDPGDGHNDTRHFLPGLLDVGLPGRSIDPLAGSLTAGDAATVRVAGAARDVWTLARERHVRLQASSGRVWLWQTGQTLLQAIELMRGELRSPAFDFEADAFSCEIAAPVEAENVSFPPALIGDPGRFPDAPDDALGSAVPVIYGQTGGLQLYAVSDVTADPIQLLIAGHPIDSTTVTPVDGDGGLISLPVAVDQGIDGLGDVYSYIEIAKADYDTANGNVNALNVTGWPDADGSALNRLGDVLLHLWTQYARQPLDALDRSRCFAARASLNRFVVGAAFDSPVQGATLMEALGSRFAGQFPVAFGYIGGRFGWDAVDLPGDGEGRPAARIVFGRNAFERAGFAETSRADVRNRFRVTYDFDGFQGQNTGAINLDADSNGLCRRSQTRWGVSAVVGVDAFDAADSGTATLIAAGLARRQSMVHVTGGYAVAGLDLLALPFLCEVEVIDADLGFDGERFFLTGVTPRSDAKVVDVQLLRVKGL